MQWRLHSARKQILIAPSWQEDNLLDSCVEDLIDSLYGDDYKVIVRPHPEYMKRFGGKMQRLVDKYEGKVGEGLEFELDFSSNTSVYSSDLLVTDWSGIGIEFGFATLKPVVFINTKIKMENEKKNYSETLNLPKTEFPMRGNLPEREPAVLEKQNEVNVYEKLFAKNTLFLDSFCAPLIRKHQRL